MTGRQVHAGKHEGSLSVIGGLLENAGVIRTRGTGLAALSEGGAIYDSGHTYTLPILLVYSQVIHSVRLVKSSHRNSSPFSLTESVLSC